MGVIEHPKEAPVKTPCYSNASYPEDALGHRKPYLC